MMGLLRWIYLREFAVAMHLGAFGDWWAARIVRRLEKLDVPMEDLE